METLNHGTEEQFEAYALHRLSDAEEQILEEHLLFCGACRKELDRTMLYLAGMREALAEAAPQRDWLAWLRPALMPRYALGAALAALFLALALYFVPGRGVSYAPVVALQLTAIRGEAPAIQPTRELDLMLGGLPASGGPFKVEIVNSNGGQVWSGTTYLPSVAIAHPFGPGAYFVRLYSANGDLLHEYGFRVEAAHR